MKKKTTFDWGDLTKIANSTGITRGHLNNILKGRRPANPVLLMALVEASEKIGVFTSIWDWENPLESTNSAFVALSEKGVSR